MAITDKYYDLVVKELTDEISDEEQLFLHRALDENPALAQKYKTVKEFWQHQGPTELPHQIIEKTEKKLGFVSDKTKWTRNGNYFKIVASILVILSLSFSAYQNFKAQPQVVLNEYFCQAGEVKEITLSDGTRVWLNAQSYLLANEPFVGENREVKLIGEAYFEVAHQPKQPFIVSSQGLATTVLGTHFNISAYLGDEKHAITLYEGKVQLEVEDAPEKSIFLTPGKKATFLTNNQKISVSEANYVRPAEWRNGVLNFYDEDFYSIAKKLERKYETTILIADAAVGELHFTANFDIESLEKIFELLKKAHSFNYTKTKNGFIIKSNQNEIFTS